ncbi:MAG: insulinase family protein [Proteobacteria bacterium]|nr:insulinase family protein [Pseudomonadota bacterium]
MTSRRLLPPLAAVACLAFAAGAPAAVWAQAAPAHDFPQAHSDLPADPAVRYGVLPNGMRYAIMKNASPTGQASIRLRFASGSLEESDAQQGLAHFLEHMAFKGSKHVPEGEMIKILERKGLAFGPDTNASTSFDQTIYMLDLPETDADTVDTGLMLMRETASELTLTQSAMDPERGVVLSEERLRSTPAYRAGKKQIDFLLQGQLVPNRFPIGDVKVLQTAPVSQIRAYYEANYRPDRAVLVVVGDIDPDQIEAKIKAKFSDWKPVGKETAEPNLGTVATRGPQTNLVVETGVSNDIEIQWVKPYVEEPDTVARRQKDLVRALGFAVLNRRLEKLGRAEHPPYLSASAGSQRFLKSAQVTALNVESQPGAWAPALDAVVLEQRRILQYGVRPDELQREITETRTALQNAVAAASTRRTPQLANTIAGSIGEDRVFTTPEESLAVFEGAVKGLDPKAVDAALRDAFQGNGPLLSVTSPTPVEGGQAAVEAEFAKARAMPVSEGAAEAAKTWPYTNFGPAGQVVERKEVKDLGVTFVRFANGVRLTVKPTQFRKDQILVSVHIADGRLDLPRDHASPLWATSAFIQGGLKGLSQDEIERVLASRTYSAGLAVGDDAFVLGGRTKPADLDLQMQVLTAHLTQPGWRPAAYDRIKSATVVALDQIEATSQGVLAETLQTAIHPGDPRFTQLPTREEAKAGTLDQLKAMLSGPLATGPIEIDVIGDVTVDQAVASVASTFAALPKRAAAGPEPKGAKTTTLPRPTPVGQPLKAYHHGRQDQAVAFVAWPTADTLSDPHRTRVLALTGRILGRRLIDQVRIAEGATYSPSAGSSSSTTFPGYGLMTALVETPPAKIDTFFADVDKIASDMAKTGVTADEMDRARKPDVESIGKRRQTNEYWLGALAGAQTDPRKLDYVRTDTSDLESVTAEEVRKAAATYLQPSRAMRVEVLPAPAPAAAPAPAKPN